MLSLRGFGAQTDFWVWCKGLSVTRCPKCSIVASAQGCKDSGRWAEDILSSALAPVSGSLPQASC